MNRSENCSVFIILLDDELNCLHRSLYQTLAINLASSMFYTWAFHFLRVFFHSFFKRPFQQHNTVYHNKSKISFDLHSIDTSACHLLILAMLTYRNVFFYNALNESNEKRTLRSAAFSLVHTFFSRSSRFFYRIIISNYNFSTKKKKNSQN